MASRLVIKIAAWEPVRFTEGNPDVISVQSMEAAHACRTRAIKKLGYEIATIVLPARRNGNG